MHVGDVPGQPVIWRFSCRHMLDAHMAKSAFRFLLTLQLYKLNPHNSKHFVNLLSFLFIVNQSQQPTDLFLHTLKVCFLLLCSLDPFSADGVLYISNFEALEVARHDGREVGCKFCSIVLEMILLLFR